MDGTVIRATINGGGTDIMRSTIHVDGNGNGIRETKLGKGQVMYRLIELDRQIMRMEM